VCSRQMTNPKLMTRLFPIVLCCCFIFSSNLAFSQPFSATTGLSDAYIDVAWDLSQACFEDASNNDEAYEEGVFLELMADGSVIYTEIIDDAMPSAVDNVYRHFVGPGKAINYELILYEIGPGDEITVVDCSSLTTTGGTLPFQPPTGVTATDATRVDAIELTWTNKSELSTSFQVVRKTGTEEVTVAVIPGTTITDSTFTYVDAFSLTSPNSLVNGVAYEYCIRTYSQLTNSAFTETTFPSVTDMGSTYDIGFSATDFTLTDQVDLVWNDISAFADAISLRRNDNVFADFENNTVVSASDVVPTYGFNSSYSLDILNEDRVIIVRASDEGGVEANGSISGFVRNSDGIGIEGIQVKYTVEVLDTTIQDSILTDFTGFYTFEDVFYGRSGNFSLTAKREGASITPSLLEVTLNNDQPVVTDADFVFRSGLSPSEDSVAINTFIPDFGEDRIDFTWDYFTTSDTTQFLLFREGQLIGSTNSTEPVLTLSDLTGKPSYFYIYELKAYAIRNDSFAVASAKDTVQFPDVTTPENLQVQDDFNTETDGILTLSWTHSSSNYDGFHIYRNDSLIAVLPQDVTFFSDYTGKPGATYDYKVSAFRKFNSQELGEELFESAFLSSDGNVYPAFIQADNVTAAPQAGNNAVSVTWDIPAVAANADNYTGFKIYRDGIEIGEILKGDDYEFLDLQGLPGSSVTYSIRTYLLQLDTTYLSAPVTGAPSPVLFPVINEPVISGVSTAPGKATVSIAGAYNSGNRNYDGYILYADGIAFDTLQPHQTQGTYYPNTNGTSVSIDFEARAYRNINGRFFTSSPAMNPANVPLNNDVLEAPGNFNASEEFPMHVALTWTYPVFKLSEFVVRRGTTIIDTLPTSARAYYDYESGVGVTEEYSVTAIYEGASSIPVYDTGRKRNTAAIFAYVFNDQNGRNLDSLQVTLEGGGLYFGQAFTNRAGLAIIESLPVDNTNIATVNLMLQGRSVSAAVSTLPNPTQPVENTDLFFNFDESFQPLMIPPLPRQDSVPIIVEAVAEPFVNSRKVAITWSPSEGQYDGFEVYRGLNKIATVNEDGPFFLFDSLSGPAIEYIYLIRAFQDVGGQRIYNRTTPARVVFPGIKSVENLTATASYDGDDNSVSLNWSHKTGEVDYYQVTRNDEVLGLVNAGSVLEFKDVTGKPDQTYIYSVRAVKLSGSTLLVSDPKTVETVFPRVADPEIVLQALPDSNAVKVSWTYSGDLVSGYRVSRDGVLIATLEASDTCFQDISGTPETIHEYGVIAILERGNMNFQSEGATDTITFPIIRKVINLMATSQTNLGNAALSFEYYAEGVDYFKMTYMIDYIDQGGMMQDSTVEFQLFYNELENNMITFLDELAIPGAAIDYMITAISVRDGILYESESETVTLASYPSPPAPTNFQATDGIYDNRVEMTWELNVEANIDSFEIRRDGVKIAMLAGGRRSYADVFNGIGNMPSGNFTYTLIAYRRDYEVNFTSAAATDTGYPGLLREGYNTLADPGVSATFGWAVSAHQDILGVGSPSSDGGAGRISFFEFNNDWTLRRSISGNVFGLSEWGSSIDAFNGHFIAGAPGSNSQDGFIGYYDTFFPSLIIVNNAPITNSRLGEAVAVSGSRYYYTEQPDTPTPSRQITGVNLTYSPFAATEFTTQVQAANPSNQKYVSMDASDSYLVAGATTNTTTEEGFVDVYERNGNSMSAIKRMDGEEDGNNFGTSVSLSGNLLAVGADGKESGRVYIYRVTGSSPFLDPIQEISQPGLDNNTGTDLFGSSVAMSDDYLIIGARNHYDIGSSSSRTGLAYLYKRNGSSFDYIDVMNIPGGLGSSGDDFGFSVAACDEGFLVGAPYFGSKGGVFYYSIDLLELWNEKLVSVTASDGTSSSRTRVEWEFTGNRDYINGFNVYRDDELIATEDPNKSFYLDTEGIPGKNYVYKVTVLTTEDRESLPKSDAGFRKGKGVFEGDVLTASGGAPVPGTTITARAEIEGELFSYLGTTDVAGHFYIDGVYYADTTVTYELTASLDGHDFVTNPIFSTISPENSVKSNILFLDNTAYIVKGQVAYAGFSCGLDSITVKAVYRFSDNTTRTDEVSTIENGAYSFVLRPDELGLQEIEILIDSIQTRSINNGMETDTILHDFAADTSTIITDFNNLPRVYEINWADSLTYDVELFVTTVCGGPASSNGEFDIEISLRDGCFQKLIRTSNTGRVTIPLPPVEDLIITVKSAIPTTVENVLIVDYLRYRPAELDLETLHIANFKENYSAEVLDSLTQKNLVYHKPASISIASEFGELICGDASEPRLITQDDDYTIRFAVEEFIQGDFCTVNEGYIVVNNAAAQTNTIDTLFYRADRNEFDPHPFIGGAPNLVVPYRKGIDVKYFSGTGDLLAQEIIPVIVLGSAPLPGSDIIVDVTDENGIVKFPIYILRDPPGDGSFSSIEEGTTFTKSLTENTDYKGGGGFLIESSFAVASVGGFIDTELIGGKIINNKDAYQVKVETKQEIETSSTADFVGPDADVLVGIGASTQYGIVQSVQYDENTCEINKVDDLSISLNEIKTDWYYTVGQIKQLINERFNQIDSVRAGTLNIQVGGVELDTSQAIGRLLTEANNWESVLNYWSRESVPYYMLCAEEYNADQLWREALETNKFFEYLPQVGVFADDEAVNNSTMLSQDLVDFFLNIGPTADFSTRIQRAEEARNEFCTDNRVGYYNAQDSFILNQPLQEIIFTTDLAQKYERSARSVDYFLDSLYLSISEVEDKLGDFSTLTGISSDVENSTFSAGVDVVKSTAITRTTSSTYENRSWIDFSLAGGIVFEWESTAGFGFEVENSDVKFKGGAQLKLGWEWGKEYFEESEVQSTVSYTLSDDDPGDQFSVTAIKGRDPGHTPYFQLLGGRSSCPPEEGTISRDIFDISLYDPETESTFDFQELNNLDPNEPATFYVQLTNLSPFGEQRDFFVYHEGESNENGAALRLNGAALGGGNQTGQTLTFINPNQPVILPLTVTRSLNNYQFDSIYVVLRPSCTDGDLFLLGERDTVTISANFDYPCSDISIASPGNDWLISRRNPFDPLSRENLIIEIRDYEATNPNLEEIYLEYRRIGDGSGWAKIPTGQLDPNYVVLSDSLVAYNEDEFGPGQIPKFFFVWDITEIYTAYPDGIYEVRAISFCGTSGKVQSNIIRGQIRRQTGDVFALTEPADGIWQAGDKISIKVNKELDCSKLGNFTFEVTERVTGNAVPGDVFCFANENKLIFEPDDATLLTYDGQILDAIVYGLEDEVGNIYLDTFRWDFRVVARDIFVQDTSLEITIYQDTEGELNTVIFYNDDIGFISFITDGNANYPWLTVDPSTGSVPAATGRAINFTIDGTQLPVGDTTAVIRFLSTSGLSNQGEDAVTIKVNVLAKPPYWVVDPTQYTTSVPVITNYAFSNAPGVTSRDSMDIISAWIGNEIRGVARISSTQVGQYASFMLVYGDPEDVGTPLEFRVWDANEGREYNGYPIDSLFFDDTEPIGSFGDPEILIVDRNRDLARYIPVNGEEDGGGGITWLSFNNEEEDMSAGEQLRELKFLRNGDIIKTESKSAGYVETVGWLSTNGLDSIEAEEGYILFLGGLDDTIRVTGENAEFGPIPLEQGWNLIGAPVQDTIAINNAFNVFNVSDGDFLTTVAQDPTLLGLSTNMVAQYNLGLSQWLFGMGSGMEVIRPNFAYQIRVASNNAVMVYDGATSPLTAAPVTDGNGESVAAFVPSDPSTWSVDPSEYPSSMVVTGVALFNEAQSLDVGDKIAAYVNGECRGTAHISHIPALGDYMAPIFIYGTNAGDVVEILMYDASEGQVYLAKETLIFEPNGIVGSFTDPYAFENQSMSAAFERLNTYCEADTSGSLSITMVSGLTPPYSYTWSNGSTGTSLNGIAAGSYSVTVTGQGGIAFTDTVLLENLNIEIPVPTIDMSTENPVCRGTDVVLYATPPNQEATVVWQNSDGEVIKQGNSLLLEHLESAFTAYATTVYRGCNSEPLEAIIEVYEPDASFAIAPPEELTTATAVQFSPGDGAGSFAWSFGDGAESDLVAPLHQYELPGHYQASLARTDLAGCTGYGLYDIWVGVATQTLELPEGKIQLQATPNPFSQYLDVVLDLPYGGTFELELLSISGQRIERTQAVWEAGKHSIRLTPDISDGTYLLQLKTDRGHRLALPIIKQSPRP